jgi:hypothetical protein
MDARRMRLRAAYGSAGSGSLIEQPETDSRAVGPRMESRCLTTGDRGTRHLTGCREMAAGSRSEAPRNQRAVGTTILPAARSRWWSTAACAPQHGRLRPAARPAVNQRPAQRRRRFATPRAARRERLSAPGGPNAHWGVHLARPVGGVPPPRPASPASPAVAKWPPGLAPKPREAKALVAKTLVAKTLLAPRSLPAVAAQGPNTAGFAAEHSPRSTSRPLNGGDIPRQPAQARDRSLRPGTQRRVDLPFRPNPQEPNSVSFAARLLSTHGRW